MRWGVMAALCAGLFQASCDEQQRANAASTAASAAIDLAAYCEQVCQRTTACGLEAAEALAAKGSKTDKEALAAARANAKQTETACAKGCRADPPSQGLVKASRCLREPDCEQLTACLQSL